jgi:hypothetical protein
MPRRKDEAPRPSLPTPVRKAPNPNGTAPYTSGEPVSPSMAIPYRGIQAKPAFQAPSLLDGKPPSSSCIPMDRSNAVASGSSAIPDRSEGLRPLSRARISSDPGALSLSGSTGHPGETSQTRDGGSRDRSHGLPLEGLTTLSGYRIRMYIDASRLQRRRDLRTRLGAGAGETEAKRDSGVTEAPETRASRLRRERPCPDDTPPRPACWGIFRSS